MTDADPTLASAVDQVIAQFGRQPGPLLPVLHAVQDRFGYIPAAAVAMIASGLNLSRAEVHGVVSFYHYFREHPPGRHVLKLCRAEACQAMHGQALQAHVQATLAVGFDATTADGVFSLEAVYCLGNCAAAPSAMIGDQLYGRLSPQRLDELIAYWRAR
jgi:formate dehydrogenase subunit gamma